MTNPTSASLLRARRQRGFSILDLLVGISILVVALLTQLSGAISNHRLIQEQTARTHAFGAAKQVIAELRSDEDWPGLYARLRFRQVQAEAGLAPLPLSGGRTAWLPQAYYPTLVTPPGLDDLGVLVEVPPVAVPTSGGTPALREDTVDPRFDLPADLNSDTLIDGESRNDDYLMLPVVVVVRWRSGSGSAQEARLPTWLRGER